jgi:hypothetical protein
VILAIASYSMRQIASHLSSWVSWMKTVADADMELGNKQVLARTFGNLVRYALRKTHRDAAKLGVTPGSFSVEAMDESLAAHTNAGIFEKQGAPSLNTLLKKAREPSMMFHFYWKDSIARMPMEAVFALSYQPDGDLEARLLWLGLPERVPISSRVGVFGHLRPIEEAVAELLRPLEDGRIAPYPPPD